MMFNVSATGLVAHTFLDVLSLSDAFPNIVVVPLCRLGHESLMQARAEKAISKRILSAEV